MLSFDVAKKPASSLSPEQQEPTLQLVVVTNGVGVPVGVAISPTGTTPKSTTPPVDTPKVAMATAPNGASPPVAAVVGFFRFSHNYSDLSINLNQAHQEGA